MEKLLFQITLTFREDVRSKMSRI